MPGLVDVWLQAWFIFLFPCLDWILLTYQEVVFYWKTIVERLVNKVDFTLEEKKTSFVSHVSPCCLFSNKQHDTTFCLFSNAREDHFLISTAILIQAQSDAAQVRM